MSAMLLMAIVLSGCTVGNTQFVFGELVDRDLVFDMGSYGDCDKQTAYVYLLIEKAEYEKLFGEEVWQLRVDDLTMEEFVKNNTLSELLQRESMSALAEYEGFELSKEQLEDIGDAAKELYESGDEEKLAALQITVQTIEAVLKARLLSELIYTSIADKVNTEISDSEAKVITVQYIRAEVGTELVWSDEEEVTEVDICRGELLKTLGSEAEEVVFALEEGDISRVITIDGYCYIFKSINDYDAGKTEKNKAVMLDKRKQDAFLNKYKEFMDSTDYEINEELWETITISELEGIALEGFYDICDKYGI